MPAYSQQAMVQQPISAQSSGVQSGISQQLAVAQQVAVVTSELAVLLVPRPARARQAVMMNVFMVKLFMQRKG